MPVLALLFLSCLAPSLQQGDAESDAYPLTPPIASAEVVEQDNATCPSAEALDLVRNTLQPVIQSTTDIAVPCTPRVKGLVSHCPASNCTELFNLAQEEGLIFLSNYYWLVGTTGEVRRVYCNRDTQQPEYSSCEELFELNDLPSGDYTIRPSGGSPVSVYCNNETGQIQNIYTSCAQAHQVEPDLPSGTYTIRPSGGSPVTVYCDMDSEGCGGGGWTRVASYNYNDPSIACPNNWEQITDPFRGCTIPDPNLGCSSSLFSTLVEFSQVCGKVIGVQFDSPDAFIGPDDIDSYYVSGVSITHGTPREHIWSFGAYPHDGEHTVGYLCPCSQPSLDVPPPPSFVGNNYFCDTGLGGGEPIQNGWQLGDPLWDGEGCPSTSTCCSFNNPPWFSTTLPQNTTDDIEVRICHHDSSGGDDNTAIIQLDLYIK